MYHKRLDYLQTSKGGQTDIISNCKHIDYITKSLQWILAANPACGLSLAEALYYSKTSVSLETDLRSVALVRGSGCLHTRQTQTLVP